MRTNRPTRGASWRRLLAIGTLGAAVGLVVIPLNPENRLLLRLAFLACVAGVWIGCLIVAWACKPLRTALLILPALAVLLFFLPGRPLDVRELQADYARRLGSFAGVKYFWGGESSRGIDCSGLPRKALRDALFSYGIRRLDSQALRAGWEQWWFDASAEALSRGYRDLTVPLGISGRLRTLDVRTLEPGDLAITAGGVHVLVYRGDHRWIQADPGSNLVVEEDTRTSQNGWFDSPVTLHRWRIVQP